MKNQKGITLIALIITIIVMLILVSVSITIAIQTGLFKSASDATKGWNEAQHNETDVDGKVNTTVNGTSVTGLQNIVNAYTTD